MLRRRNHAPNSEKSIIQPTEKDRIFKAKKPLFKSIPHKKTCAKREKRQRTLASQEQISSKFERFKIV
jgi:hypothetical protein